MLTGPGRGGTLVFIFPPWCVRATVPLIWMLPWPAVHCWSTATGQWQSWVMSHILNAHKQLPPTTIGLTCDPGAVVGIPMCMLANCVRGCWRRARGLDLQRVFLQVFFDNIKFHLSRGGDCRSAPGPSICTQLIHHLIYMEAETWGQVEWCGWTTLLILSHFSLRLYFSHITYKTDTNQKYCLTDHIQK